MASKTKNYPVKDIAKQVGCTEKFVIQLCERKRIEFYNGFGRNGGSTYLIPETEIGRIRNILFDGQMITGTYDISADDVPIEPVVPQKKVVVSKESQWEQALEMYKQQVSELEAKIEELSKTAGPFDYETYMRGYQKGFKDGLEAR